MAGDGTLVIKRVKKGAEAHHGGAWKVAYADFVTAMMAFFLLMWLIKARILLQQVAKIIDRLPNRIAITGHTDAAPFKGPDGVTNWELSAARANAARAVLATQGLDSDRFFSVSGKAGTDPLLPDNPYASSNRRISILLMREAPVVPPGHQL